MTTIDALTQNQRTDMSAVPTNPKGDMGKETFLKLLVAELKNQDPNDPMQAREMVAQLAQLSSVEKLTGIDSKLGEMTAGNTATATLQSAGLIGRNVTGDSRRLVLTNTMNPQGTYQLAAAADKVTISVVNDQGDVVREIDSGAQRAGQQQFLWDGKLGNGLRGSNGSYTFNVTATDNKGNPVQATTAIHGMVTEVTYENGAPQVVVDGAHIPLGDVTSIEQ